MKCRTGLMTAHSTMMEVAHYSMATFVAILIHGTKTPVIEAHVLV